MPVDLGFRVGMAGSVGWGVGSGFFSDPTFSPTFSPGSAPTSTLILPGMSTSPPAIQGLVDHLEAVSASRSARRCCLDWAAAEPVLAGHRSPAVVADAIRTARPGVQDELISALVRLGAHDQLAQVTVVAGLSRRLGWIVTTWKRAGVPGDELRTMESDLVSECWAAAAVLARAVADGGGLPPRPAMAIVQTAWEQVRDPRRRQRRHDARQAPEPGRGDSFAAGRPRRRGPAVCR